MSLRLSGFEANNWRKATISLSRSRPRAAMVNKSHVVRIVMMIKVLKIYPIFIRKYFVDNNPMIHHMHALPSS